MITPTAKLLCRLGPWRAAAPPAAGMTRTVGRGAAPDRARSRDTQRYGHEMRSSHADPSSLAPDGGSQPPGRARRGGRRRRERRGSRARRSLTPAGGVPEATVQILRCCRVKARNRVLPRRCRRALTARRPARVAFRFCEARRELPSSGGRFIHPSQAGAA